MAGAIDAAALRALSARLVTPERVLFPVRHHSPACALHLRRLIAELNPCAVLVEGPRSFDPLISQLVRPEARMPVAAYAFAVWKRNGEQPERRQSAFYPFCDYSPELVALREASARGIPARFIDLDFVEQALLETDTSDDEAERSLLDESHYRRSAYLQALAKQEGCRDVEELWEHLFEVDSPGASPEEHLARMTAWCQLSRADSTAAELERDGTLAREAEMAHHIAAAIAARKKNEGPVLVVVGGFHAVALPDLLEKPPTRPRISRSGISDEGAALIRYSFDRLDRLNGYASGMTSPAWHQSLWEDLVKFEAVGRADSPTIRAQGTQRLLFDIADELRTKHKLPLPMPALAAASEQAMMLARLRGRRAPVRDDVLDAVTSCFIKGDGDADGAIVLAVARRRLGGDTLGSLAPGGPQSPLVKDFHYRARRQRLRIDDSDPRRAVLDIYRRADHRLTSRLLHGLSFLGVPFATRTSGPDFVTGVGLERLQEQWEYCFSPATEGALVEASLFGATVPEAVAARFVVQVSGAEAAGSNSRAAASLLVKAFVLGLHDHVGRVGGLLAQAIAADAEFASVVMACTSTALLWESREPLEAREARELPALLQASYQRAIYLATELRVAKGDEPAAVAALSQLRELLVGQAGRDLDASLYWTVLQAIALSHPHPLLRGAALGLLYSAQRVDTAGLRDAIHGHLAAGLAPAQAVAFLGGVLHTAREVAWQEPELLRGLDALFAKWNEEEFVANLPELRLAFAGMTPKETDRIAASVADLHGVEELGELVQRDLSAAEVQRNLTVSAELRALLAADGIADWVAP
jgi:hypothetical protein